MPESQLYILPTVSYLAGKEQVGLEEFARPGQEDRPGRKPKINRQEVTVGLDLDPFLLDGAPLEKLIPFLQDLKDKHPDKSLFLSMDYDDTSCDLRICYNRKQTDQEWQKAILGLMREVERDWGVIQKQKQRDKDRKEFDRLRAKHGW